MEIFTDIVAKIKTGDGLYENIDMGPMANSRKITAMRQFVGDAIKRGGRVLLGGTSVAKPGYIWPPTLVTSLPDDADLMREEPFGPVLPISHFSTFDEAIRRANDNAYGLAVRFSEAVASRRTSQLALRSILQSLRKQTCCWRSREWVSTRGFPLFATNNKA